jgi:hypothetical protein
VPEKGRKERGRGRRKGRGPSQEKRKWDKKKSLAKDGRES